MTGELQRQAAQLRNLTAELQSQAAQNCDLSAELKKQSSQLRSLTVEVRANWTYLYQNGSYGDLKMDKEAFNQQFHNSSGIIRRRCADCAATHKEAYYKRRGDYKQWDAYTGIMLSFSDTGAHESFDIFSTLADALADRHAWKGYGAKHPDQSHGFPGDSGPNGLAHNQWTTANQIVAEQSGIQNFDFAVLAVIDSSILLPESADGQLHGQGDGQGDGRHSRIHGSGLAINRSHNLLESTTSAKRA
jgi:hypothetical protein